MLRKSWLAMGAALLMTGCFAAAPQGSVELVSQGTGGPAADAPPFPVELQGCTLGGAHTLYNMRTFEGLLPEPWVPTDVHEDVGNPLVLTMGNPNLGGDITGILHVALVCDAWTLGGDAQEGPLQGGFVGVRVEPPAFDPGGAARHYILAALSFNSDAVVGPLVAQGLHATRGSAVAEFQGPLFHAFIDSAGHGQDEALWLPGERAEVEPWTTRLWMLHEPQAGKGYRPVSLDLERGPATKLLAEQGEGWYSHTGTDDHAPLPGGYGNAAGLAYVDFEGALRLGPAPDLTLWEGWEH